MLGARRRSLSRAHGVSLQGSTAGDTSASGHCSWLPQSWAQGPSPMVMASQAEQLQPAKGRLERSHCIRSAPRRSEHPIVASPFTGRPTEISFPW